jgi:outer membrane protein, heavy metal efflux system
MQKTVLSTPSSCILHAGCPFQHPASPVAAAGLLVPSDGVSVMFPLYRFTTVWGLADRAPVRSGARWRARVSAVMTALVIAPVAAQIAPANSLTLQAAMDRALVANPTIAAARLASAINLAGLALASERPNPEATVEFEKETPKQAFGVALPIELGGKRTKRIAVSQAAIRAGEAELAATIVQVRNDVRRAYYDVLVTDARSSVLRELRDLSQRVRDTAQARFDTGDAPRLEVLQATLALAGAENEAIAAQGLSVAARTRLNALLGQPLDMAQPLSTPLGGGGPIPTDAAVDLARTGSAELAVLDRQIEQQRASVTLAHALRVPDLIPTATLTHDAQPEFTYGWRAGLAVTVPILTTHKAAVLVEQSTLDHLMAQREAAVLRITAEVTAAATAAEAQRQTYLRYQEIILPQAQQVEQLAQDSYKLGQTGIAALLQALQASRDVRLRSLDAVSAFQAAVADLERAIGAPLP